MIMSAENAVGTFKANPELGQNQYLPRAPVASQPIIITPEQQSASNPQAKRLQVEKLREQVEKLSKSLNLLQLQQEKDNEIKPIVPIKTLTFVSDSPFVLLPRLSTIKTPWGYWPVASRKWLKVLDYMRATGISLNIIDEFLLVSAWVVWIDLNHEVVEFNDTSGSKARFTMKSFQTLDAFRERVRVWKTQNVGNTFINHVEQFCAWYPEETRQNERLKKGYSYLIRSIKQQTTSAPFIAKQKDGKYVCPPEDPVSFTTDGITVPNILRNFSETKKTYIRNPNDTAAEVMECTPPEKLKYSWIPIEYRQILEEKFNLTQYHYIPSATFKAYLYSLVDPEKETYRDNNNKPYLLTQSTSGKGYQVYLAKIILSTPPYPDRPQVGKGKQTLREFLGDKMASPEYYPLVQVILNAPAPPANSPMFASFSAADYLYSVGNYWRMTCDAPVEAFRHSLLQTYVENRVLPQEETKDCLARFVDAVYKDCFQGVGRTMLQSDIIPPTYQDVLEQLFYYGDQSYECKFKPISEMNFGRTETKTEIIKTEDMTPRELELVVQKLTQTIMSDKRFAK